MKKIYVAGPYNDNNVLGVLKNIGRGQYYSNWFFNMGLAPFCPWFDRHFVIEDFSRDFNVEQFREYSMVWLRVCDAVFIVPNYEGMKDWKDSSGTLAEIKEAERLGIPVFYEAEDVKKWMSELV